MVVVDEVATAATFFKAAMNFSWLKSGGSGAVLSSSSGIKGMDGEYGLACNEGDRGGP